MFLAGKAAWAAIVFLLLTTCISGPRPAPVISRAVLNNEVPNEVQAEPHPNDVKEMQQILQHKGHYRGKVDGVPGLRTRASIRGFQKAESLPATGQLDTQTAGRLGVKSEVHPQLGDETTTDKPSAGIKRTTRSRRTSNTVRKLVKKSVAPPTELARREKQLQPENDKASR